MSFEKQFGEYIVHFDWIEVPQYWNIWFQLNNKIYHKIETFAPHLPINRPKQIKHLFDKYDSTFDRIEGKWCINVDYIFGDCVILIKLENEEERLRGEIEVLELKLREREEKCDAYEKRLTELDFVIGITKINIPESYDITFNIPFKTVIDIRGKYQRNITLSGTIFQRINIEGQLHDNQKILQLYGAGVQSKPIISQYHFLYDIRNGDGICRDFEEILIKMCHNIEKYDKKNIDNVEIRIHSGHEYIPSGSSGGYQVLHVYNTSIKFSLTFDAINPIKDINFYMFKEIQNNTPLRQGHQCRDNHCHGGIFKSNITRKDE